MAGRKLLSHHEKGIEIWPRVESRNGCRHVLLVLRYFLAHEIFTIYWLLLISIIINRPGDQNSG